MSGRNTLAASIKTALALPVVSTARPIDVVQKSGAVVLWTSERRRVAVQGLTHLQDTIPVWILSGADVEHLEDDLDDLLLKLLEVIEAQDSFSWDTARRAVLADKWDGWVVDVTCVYSVDNEPDDEPA